MKIKFPQRNEIFQWIISIAIFSPIGIETCFMLFLFLWASNTNKTIKLSKYLLVLLTIITTISIIQINSMGYNYNKFFQQITLISIYSISYYNIIKTPYFDINSIFKKIYTLAIILSWIGIFQFLIDFLFSYQLFGSAYRLRITSLIAEPGYLARCLFPILAYSILTKKWHYDSLNFFILLSSYILTMSAVGYFVLTIFLIHYLLFNSRYHKIFRIVFTIGIIGLLIINFEYKKLQYFPTNEIVLKLNETVLQFDNFEPKAFETLNLSTYALLTNMWVAINSPQRIIGTGLGTHRENYFKTTDYSTFSYYGLNSDDGYSLAIRLYSEFGLLLIIFLIVLLSHYRSNDYIKISLFFTLFFILLRGGHYTQYGTIFLFLTYFINSKTTYT